MLIFMASDIVDKNLNNSKTILFDDSCYPKVDKPLSVERVRELEETLGKALLERFRKEIKSGNLGNKK